MPSAGSGHRRQGQQRHAYRQAGLQAWAQAERNEELERGGRMPGGLGHAAPTGAATAKRRCKQWPLVFPSERRCYWYHGHSSLYLGQLTGRTPFVCFPQLSPAPAVTTTAETSTETGAKERRSQAARKRNQGGPFPPSQLSRGSLRPQQRREPGLTVGSAPGLTSPVARASFSFLTLSAPPPAQAPHSFCESLPWRLACGCGRVTYSGKSSSTSGGTRYDKRGPAESWTSPGLRPQ